MAVRCIPPHGGELIDRTVRGERRDELLMRAERLPHIRLHEREITDLEMIAVGGYSPLRGFVCRRDYETILSDMRLSNGLPWSIPITLSINAEEANNLKHSAEALLTDDSGTPLAIMRVEDIYEWDPAVEAQQVYRTTDSDHPGVAYLYRMEKYLVGGEIWLLNRTEKRDFLDHYLDPAETRAEIRRRGWRRVVGFQTRNPIHRAHEYIQKCAMEIVDGLLLNPVVGATKQDDIPAEIRMLTYKALIDRYYPKDRVMMVVLPIAMRYAGPREAVLHALVRKNFGCTHFIVGRDHAGVGDYYGTYDAHYIFDTFKPEELGITPLFFDHAFYCLACGGMATKKTCPHPERNHVYLSGTRVREMLRRGEALPAEFMRPEVARILMEAMQRRKAATLDSNL